MSSTSWFAPCPKGVSLIAVKQSGAKIEIKVRRNPTPAFPALMRNIDKSEWLKEPDLEVVEVKPASGKATADASAPRASEFTVIAKQVSAGDEEDAR